MIVYVLTRKFGSRDIEPSCSLSLTKLCKKMREEYNEGKNSLEIGTIVEYAKCTKTEARIEAGTDKWEWRISQFELPEKIVAGQYMGTKMNFSKLLGKDEIIHRLQKTGPNYKSLEDIRDEYIDLLGTDPVWNYVLDDDLHTGFMMIPVKEGFFALPYDEVYKDTYEQYVLEDAKLFDYDSISNYIDNWERYTSGLLKAFREAQALLSKEVC